MPAPHNKKLMTYLTPFFLKDVFIRSIKESNCNLGIIFSEEFGNIESYHLWLQYFPSACFGADWKKKLNQGDANGFSQIEVKFEHEGPGLEITKCGAHLVYKQDIEDLNQTKAVPSNCTITPYDDDRSVDSEKDTN